MQATAMLLAISTVEKYGRNFSFLTPLINPEKYRFDSSRFCGQYVLQSFLVNASSFAHS
jgi:hypothetical protein